MNLCKCGKKKYANSSMCYTCWLKHERQKRVEKALRKKEKKKLTKKFQNKLRKILHKKAWKLISEYVRRKDIDELGYTRCYTCKKTFSWHSLNAGHRYHNRLDFDLRNLKPQCFQCNNPLSGNLGAYERNLIEEYGINWCKQLERDANQDLGYSIEQLNELISKYTELIKNL